MKPVTDPALLSELERTPTPVTDPDLIAKLETPASWGETAADVGESGLRGFNKALASTAMLPLRASAWLTGTQGKGLEGAAEQALSPWLKQPEPDTAAGRYAGAVGEAVGGAAIPSAGFMRAASKLPMVAPAVPTLADKFLRPIAQTPGRALGIDVAAATGAGGAQQAAQEAGAGPTGQTLAGFAGGFTLPALAPAAARGGNALLDMLPKIRMSADGGMPSGAARESAEQMIADQLLRAGVSVKDLRSQLARAQEARRFHSTGQAQEVLTLADLDPSLARLVGSAGRQHPEAANVASDFLKARQTGVTPETGQLPLTAGIETRAAMERPGPGATPAGQFERVRDALKRALLIRDEDFHGHGANAYRTEQQILTAAREEAKTLYTDAYQAGQNIDIRPHITPVLEKWAAQAMDEPGPVGAAIRKALAMFQTKAGPVSNIERFDKAKQFMDGQIERLFQAQEGRNHYLGGVLSQLKSELLGAVDNIATSDLGAKYRAARGAFGSRMEMRDALQLGQSVFRADADVAVDQFRALASPGQQKLFRLGMLGSFENNLGRSKRTADITQAFENPRIQEILEAVIPRTETATGRLKKGAAFADRPERFGRYLGMEKRMVGTRDEVLGNSKTAQRLADDQAFDTLHTFVEVFKDPRLISIGKRAFEYALNKTFGMRADVSASIAQQLFTAQPEARAMILANLEMRMGRSRFHRLTQIMDQYQKTSVGATAGTLTGVEGEQ